MDKGVTKPLWAPWRLEYVQSADDEPGCIFCLAREADAGNLVGQRVAHYGQKRPTAAGVLPDLVMLAGRIEPVIDIGIPGRLIGTGLIGARAVAVALVGIFRYVAGSAIGAGDQHSGCPVSGALGSRPGPCHQ